MPPAAARFDLLRDLPLTPGERRRLAAAEAIDARLMADAARGGAEWARVAHLPFFLVLATRLLLGAGDLPQDTLLAH
jgi:hypothetical protein